MSGWRPSLRLAWRDALRSRGRSVLVLVMIALPVLAVTTADIVYRTSEVRGAESLDRRIGAADALVRVDTWSGRVEQLPDPDQGSGTMEGHERALPTLDDLARALGRPLRGITLQETQHRVRTDHGVSPVNVDEVDLADPLARGLWRVDEGRTPDAPGEVVVNHDLASRGPGLGDTLSVVDGPDLTVVGVGDSASFRGVPMMAVPPTALVEDPAQGGQVGYLVDAGGQVTWDDVLRLNDLGASVVSRHVLHDPPAPDEVPAAASIGSGGNDAATWTTLVLVVVMALMEVVLLAGPAFAVGARRQSRTLALMAATGGTPAQARRTILAGGVVLGSLGALSGVVLGLGVAWLALPVLQRFSHAWFGPYDVAWPHLAAIAGFGLVSAILAAVVPAWVASRQDVVAVLAGRRGDRRAGLRSPALGVVLLAAGIAGAAYGAGHPDLGEVVIAGSAVVSVLGMILLTPVVLVLVARLGRHLPLVLRFAVRDAARHRTRSVPAVAAVAATVAGVVALGVAISSDERQNEAMYSPTLRTGDGVVFSYGQPEATLHRLATVVRDGLPDADVTEVQGIGDGPDGEMTSLDFRVDHRRNLLRSWGSPLGSSVVVADAAPQGLPGLAGDDLTAADQVLADGGAVVFTSRTVDDDTVLVRGRVDESDGTLLRRLRQVEAPAVFVQVPDLLSTVQAVVSPEVAERLDAPVRTMGVYVTGAEITPAQQRDVSEAVGALVPDAALYVERGFQPDDATRIVMLILVGLGAVLMLGGTLTATFLALSDARPDLATLSAVGAAPRTRRGVAASSALVIALTGALLGAVVGLIPGIAISFPLTAESWASTDAQGHALASHYLAIPWPMMGALVVALPLLTAAAIAVLARSRLPLVARLD